jgi:maleylpyruvate isomerase
MPAMAPSPAISPRSAEQVAADLAGCRAANQRLLADLAGLTDADVRRPSRLEGWTVGHVLTHLARNAESNVRMAEGVLAGEARAQYPGGAAQREGDIEAGAGRPAADLVEDLRSVTAALDAVWDAIDPDGWATGSARTSSRPSCPASCLPLLRWREVEVHHADLGLPAFAWTDWSPAFVRAELPVLLEELAGTADGLDDAVVRDLVASLAGRRSEPVALPSVVG